MNKWKAIFGDAICDKNFMWCDNFKWICFAFLNANFLFKCAPNIDNKKWNEIKR
jgi:hypothetical protein